jgi:hypothetical protein
MPGCLLFARTLKFCHGRRTGVVEEVPSRVLPSLSTVSKPIHELIWEQELDLKIFFVIVEREIAPPKNLFGAPAISNYIVIFPYSKLE